jgi:uncharacterized protein YeaO (DUF488 family)
VKYKCIATGLQVGHGETMIKLKRVYEQGEPSDGFRVLADRLWPRGISKEEAHIDEWLRDIAPSTELRKWFGHDPQKWPEFQRRYRDELKSNTQSLEKLLADTAGKDITLVYASREEKYNNVTVLKEVLQELIATKSGLKF